MSLFRAFKKEGPSELQKATTRLEEHARDLQEVVRLARIELERRQPGGAAGEPQRQDR